MLSVLKTVPGVSDARLGETTDDGVALPYVEYRAAEKARWAAPTRFTLFPASKNQIVFQEILPGLVTPGTMPDTHVTDVIVKEWKALCHVDADVITI